MHIMSSRSPVLMWLAVEFGKRSTDSIDAQACELLESNHVGAE
jgi:hypothetical protein